MIKHFAIFSHTQNDAVVYVNPHEVALLYAQADKGYTAITLKCGRIQTVSEDIIAVAEELENVLNASDS